MSHIIRLLPILTVLLLTAAGCSRDSAENARGPAARVGALTVGAVDAPRTVLFSGTVEGARRVTLGTKLMGRITSLPVDIGSRVRAGEVVARINAGDLAAKRAQVEAGSAEANAAFENARNQYDRVKNLYEKQSASRKEMDDAEMMYRMATAKVEAVREMGREVGNALDYADLRSPIDGCVVARMAQEGDLASPGMPIVVVEDVAAFIVNARVPESEIAAVAEGDPVRVRIDALDGVIDGTVAQVNAAGDPSSRQFSVKVRLTKSPGVRSGMNANVELHKGTVSALTVPNDAIVRRGGLEGLFILGENNTAVLRWVRTGRTGIVSSSSAASWLKASSSGYSGCPSASSATARRTFASPSVQASMLARRSGSGSLG